MIWWQSYRMSGWHEVSVQSTLEYPFLNSNSHSCLPLYLLNGAYNDSIVEYCVINISSSYYSTLPTYNLVSDMYGLILLTIQSSLNSHALCFYLHTIRLLFVKPLVAPDPFIENLFSNWMNPYRSCLYHIITSNWRTTLLLCLNVIIQVTLVIPSYWLSPSYSYAKAWFVLFLSTSSSRVYIPT